MLNVARVAFRNQSLRRPHLFAASAALRTPARLDRRTPTATAAARQLHTLSELPFDPSVGCAPFLSPTAVDVLYNQHQRELLETLNFTSKASSMEDMFLYDIVLKTANVPALAQTFNAASMAWNNDFFLQHLTTERQQMRRATEERIINEWGTVENFKEDFKYHALGIFGCGFTWLVKDSAGKVRILNTYNGGSPLIPQRHQTRDPKTGHLITSEQRNRWNSATTTGGAVYNSYMPLLCLNMWQHAYVPDFGVNGREEYIDRFWDAVDWSKIDGVGTGPTGTQ